MEFAGIETETDQPVATLLQILCTTPRLVFLSLWVFNKFLY